MDRNALAHVFRGMLHGALDPVTMSLLLAMPVGRRVKADADRARRKHPKYRTAADTQRIADAQVRRERRNEKRQRDSRRSILGQEIAAAHG